MRSQNDLVKHEGFETLFHFAFQQLQSQSPKLAVANIMVCLKMEYYMQQFS
jgi:hypothetical protein